VEDFGQVRIQKSDIRMQKSGREGARDREIEWRAAERGQMSDVRCKKCKGGGGRGIERQRG
jgi:hypothetical protein